ncbi:hypothetical protein JIR23_05685 [Bradyrhizobium diazoefficiens]|nr:hypothetical protein [Bradyrhizobium diazoefficiens]QQN65287.1 hypothetical protein JIR23_05685 [Bradyrhizobium diazoefficiens]
MLFWQETSGGTGSAIRELGFEVFSYGLFTKGTVKQTLGVIISRSSGCRPARATSSARMMTA